MRMMHEASLHECSVFLTLTYDDSHLPPGASLVKSDQQKFVKRLRKRFSDQRIRFFQCGEYGEQSFRPHYHGIYFNVDFHDKWPWSVRNGYPVWRSGILEELWPYGLSEIGTVTFESAAYVARYVVKKVTGRRAVSHYNGREPEYATMSRRPGIGADWFARYRSEVFPMDEVISRGRRCKPPRRYAEYLRALSPEMFEEVVSNRRSRRDRAEETPARLSVREVCASSRLNLLRRELA